MAMHAFSCPTYLMTAALSDRMDQQSSPLVLGNKSSDDLFGDWMHTSHGVGLPDLVCTTLKRARNLWRKNLRGGGATRLNMAARGHNPRAKLL
jgi:hypothetical protein